MSLVREALEKAEREAAARAAREKGLPESLSGSAGPYRAPRKKSGPRATLVVAGLTVLALTSSAWFLARSFRRPETAPAATPAVEAPPPGPASVEPSAGSEAPAIAEPTVEASPPASAAKASAPAPAPVPVAEPTPAPSTRSAAPSDGTFLRRAVLDDGRALELGGIAWSETTPLAYLNGRLRGVGEVVEGFRVDAIEPEAVALSGDAGRRLRITLR